MKFTENSLFMRNMPASPVRYKSENWATVVEAVRSFVNLEVDPPQQMTVPKSPTVNERALSRIADNLKKIELIMSDQTMDQSPERLRNSNIQLSSILRILKSDLPHSLNELVLVAEEERILREDLQAEIDVIRMKWRSEVSRLHELYSSKDVGSENDALNPAGTTETRHLRRKLAEAEAEIDQLKQIIRTFQSKQLVSITS